MSTLKMAQEFLGAVADLLAEKNAAYGDSATNPLRVFSTTDAAEQIRVRIDDKLSRVLRGQHAETEDVLMDLVGYLALLWAVTHGDRR